MFQNNLLLAQLKKKLHARIPRAEGVVKGTGKKFGFLESDNKTYFIPPLQMKKVMHGDRIVAIIHSDKNKESAEPESLVEPFLTRFVGRIHKKDKHLLIIPDHPLLKDAILCGIKNSSYHNFQTGDWVIAEMCQHPLRDKSEFYAELTEFISSADDYLTPWWVTLSRYNLERTPPPEIDCNEILDENLHRQDLTHLNFITIDSANTEDIDDALYITKNIEGNLLITIAIADPTAYIAEDSQLDKLAAQRAFTNYLPGLNIPMLPRKLSENLCSLHPNKTRPTLICRVTVLQDGSLGDDIYFSAAWIKSKARLVYDKISDWLENMGTWKPENKDIEQQIILLHHLCLLRIKWRQVNALVFKDRPEYRFILGEKGKVLDIILEQRRIANRIIEEAMVLANVCAAKVLQEKLGFGIYNLHNGFDLTNVEQVANILSNHGITINPKTIKTLEGFLQLRRKLDAQPTQYLDSRLRRFQSLAELSTKPGPHFGLGLNAYATWTSPIRKFSDMINHRLLKAIIRGDIITTCPHNGLIVTISERRRLNRMAERDISDWLYAIFLAPFAGTNRHFNATIIDVSRGGIRVRLQENGAVAFIPLSFIHNERSELICCPEKGTLQIKNKMLYRVTDCINVIIDEVRMETRSIVARPIYNINY